MSDRRPTGPLDLRPLLILDESEVPGIGSAEDGDLLTLTSQVIAHNADGTVRVRLLSGREIDLPGDVEVRAR